MNLTYCIVKKIASLLKKFFVKKTNGFGERVMEFSRKKCEVRQLIKFIN